MRLFLVKLTESCSNTVNIWQNKILYCKIFVINCANILYIDCEKKFSIWRCRRFSTQSIYKISVKFSFFVFDFSSETHYYWHRGYDFRPLMCWKWRFFCILIARNFQNVISSSFLFFFCKLKSLIVHTAELFQKKITWLLVG